MNQKKQLIVLSALLAASIAVYGGVSFGVGMNEKKLQAEAESRAAIQKEQEIRLLDTTEENITAIRWKPADADRAEFVRAENGWVNAEDENFPVLNSAADEFAGRLARLTTTRRLDEAGDLAAYKLDPAEQTIGVLLSDGSSHTLKFGDYAGTTGQCYVMLDDQPEVYLAPADVRETAEKEILSFIHKESIPMILSPTDFCLKRKDGTGFTMTKPEDPLKYSYTDYYSWFMQGETDLVPVNRSKAKQLINGVQEADFVACVSYGTDAEGMKAFGLDRPEAEVSVSDGTTTNTIRIGSLFERDGVEYRYVCLKDSDMVYAMRQENAAQYDTASVENMGQQDVIHLKWDLVTAIEADYEGEHRRIEIAPAENDPQGRKYRFTENGEELDYAKVDNIKGLIDKTTTLGMPDGKIQPGEKIIGLTFELRDGKYDRITLEFDRYNDARAYASLNGADGTLCSIIAAEQLVQFFRNLF